MTDEAAYHAGYRRALEELTTLVSELWVGSEQDLEKLRHEIRRRIDRARCAGRSSLASTASGDAGY
jgi:hypothetical protein